MVRASGPFFLRAPCAADRVTYVGSWGWETNLSQLKFKAAACVRVALLLVMAVGRLPVAWFG